MSLRLRPHTGTLYGVSPTVVGKNTAIGTSVASGGQTLRGQLTPERPSTVYESYGVVSKRPHMWMANAEDAAYFTGINMRFVIGTREFRTLTLPEVWNAETSTSFMQLIMEELEC